MRHSFYSLDPLKRGVHQLFIFKKTDPRDSERLCGGIKWWLGASLNPTERTSTPVGAIGGFQLQDKSDHQTAKKLIRSALQELRNLTRSSKYTVVTRVCCHHTSYFQECGFQTALSLTPEMNCVASSGGIVVCPCLDKREFTCTGVLTMQIVK